MDTILKQKVYHNGQSMVVLKPGDEHEVPERLRKAWRDEKVIDFEDEAEVTGEGGGGNAADVFTMAHQGFGRYLITGPGVPPDTLVKGRADAETMLGLLREEAADTSSNAPPVD